MPVLTATYWRPSTAYVTGKPDTDEPRLISQRISPVSSSKARKRPLTSPPKTSPPPVATSDIVAARWSCRQTVAPVSAEIA